MNTKTKNRIADIITEEITKSDILDIIKNDKSVENRVIDIAKDNKDFEKRVKEIVRSLIKDMYRVLWIHNDIFKSLGA